MNRYSEVRTLLGLAAAAGAASAVALAGGTASAQEPTCAGYKGIVNPGEHAVTDYVLGGVTGGPELDGWPPTGISEVVGELGGAGLPGGPGRASTSSTAPAGSVVLRRAGAVRRAATDGGYRLSSPSVASSATPSKYCVST